MANPYHHALSSARKYGGRWQDYILIHSWMDQSKSIIADGRHRALRHHAEGITMCEAVFGRESRRASDGTIIPVRTIAEQHVLEDFGFIPDAKQWLSLLPLQPWMTRHRPRGPEEANGEQREQCKQCEQGEQQGGFAEYPSAARHAIASARRYGGVPEDYLAIHEWFDSTATIIGDSRHRALRHHAEGIFTCEQVLGVVFHRASDGRPIPTRWIGEQHVLEDLGCIPSATRWLELLPLQAWMVRGARRLSQELPELPELRVSADAKTGELEPGAMTIGVAENAAYVQQAQAA